MSIISPVIQYVWSMHIRFPSTESSHIHTKLDLGGNLFACNSPFGKHRQSCFFPLYVLSHSFRVWVFWRECLTCVLVMKYVFATTVL